MREIGVEYNDRYENTYLGYIYCAFCCKNIIYVSNAIKNCVVKINMNDNKSIEKIFIPNWFPRWIVPINDKEFVFIDSKRKTFGLVKNKSITFENHIPMKKPIFVSKTPKNTFLIAGEDDEFPLIEVDINCTVLNSYLTSKYHLQSAYYVEENKFLICDATLHQVLLCYSDGTVLWEYGKKGCPGDKRDELSTPKYAISINNCIYIADGKNNRILCVDWDKKIKFIYKKDENNNHLWWPTCVDCYDGKMLISDAGNERLIEYDTTNRSSEQLGIPKVQRFMMNNPRCIEISDNVLYVADTYNNRILKINEKLEIELFWGGERGTGKENMFWPRAIRSVDGKFYYICDSRNSRIIKIDKCKNVHLIYYGFFYMNTFYEFGDPHDIDIYEGKRLIADSNLNKVIEMNLDGTCSFVYGTNCELNNPHHARRTKDGNIIISDTGNNRVIKINNKGEILREVKEVDSISLREPRWCEEIDNDFLITDSGNNRIVRIDENNNKLSEYGGKLDSLLESIRTPRCTRCFGDFMLISDTYNNRIIIDRLGDKK